MSKPKTIAAGHSRTGCPSVKAIVEIAIARAVHAPGLTLITDLSYSADPSGFLSPSFRALSHWTANRRINPRIRSSSKTGTIIPVATRRRTQARTVQGSTFSAAKGHSNATQNAAPTRPATVPVATEAHGLLGPFSGTYQRQAHTMRPVTT